jgi:prevent-host-death family protein
MEITAAKFRTNFFTILDEVDKKHKVVVITKRGRPIAKLVHFETDDTSDPLIATLPNAGRTVGDLTAPFEDVWDLD